MHSSTRQAQNASTPWVYAPRDNHIHDHSRFFSVISIDVTGVSLSLLLAKIPHAQFAIGLNVCEDEEGTARYWSMPFLLFHHRALRYRNDLREDVGKLDRAFRIASTESASGRLLPLIAGIVESRSMSLDRGDVRQWTNSRPSARLGIGGEPPRSSANLLKPEVSK